MTAFVIIKIKLHTMRIKGMFKQGHFRGGNTYYKILSRRNIITAPIKKKRLTLLEISRVTLYNKSFLNQIRM